MTADAPLDFHATANLACAAVAVSALPARCVDAATQRQHGTEQGRRAHMHDSTHMHAQTKWQGSACEGSSIAALQRAVLQRAASSGRGMRVSSTKKLSGS